MALVSTIKLVSVAILMADHCSKRRISGVYDYQKHGHQLRFDR
jgi:hypothetical protein